MLKKMLNSAQIDFDILPIDPLLIKSGQATVGGVDMSFVRTWHTGEKAEPFIPGSSIKGMIRAYSEKICRSLKDNPVPVCLPYVAPGKDKHNERNQVSCGLRFEKYKKNKKTLYSTDIYKNSCAICKLFGSHFYIGRLATSDGYLTKDPKPVFEIRDGVAIDRITGGAAKGAKYDLEVLTRGNFSTSINIRNFERWQLGLIGLVLRDMKDGLVRLGFGKSRGLGRFKAEITSFKLSYYNQQVSSLKGISKLCNQEDFNSYGFFNDIETEKATLNDSIQNGLRYDYNITENWINILEPGVKDLLAFIKQNEWPKNLDRFVRGG
ncbi:CRISPR-associated protein [Candidatus Magnetomorum sp. HK-1]|nr:CRISPR-associated protein [Candidatus Magnetomorum sp. HK-1]